MANSSANLYPLTAHVRALKEVRALLDSLGSSGVAPVHGAPRASAPVVAASLQGERFPHGARQVLVVAADPAQAASWEDELRQWLAPSVPVLHFPALEALPYERAQPEPAIIQQRQGVLEALVGAIPVMIVAPARALLQPLMDIETARGLLREVRRGGRFSVPSEVPIWRQMGYEQATVVQRPGEYCRRGGIVDVFPAGADWPLRIELVGSEIDSLRQFDPSTQRSVAAPESAVIGPLHPFVLPAAESALLELRGLDTSRCLPHVAIQWEEELSRLESGVPFDGLEFYTPYLTQKPSSLLSYLSGSATLFLDEPEALFDTMDDLTAQAQELSEELLGRGEVPPGLRSPLLAVQYVRQEVSLLPRVEWRQRVAGSGLDWSAGNVFRTAPSYAGSLKRFAQDCAELSNQQERVCIVSLQGQRLAELLAEEDVPVTEAASLESLPDRGTIVALPGQLPEGWYLPNGHLMVITDAEVAGWTRSRPAARFHREASGNFALDFQPGDIVVHIEHGIGRFQGVVRRGTGRAEREYLDLQFAGTDRLFVPTDQLDRVTKYRGMGDVTPALSKLGSQEWTRAKAKVKESVEAIARELLDLYRFREKAPGHSFAADGHWQRELEAAFPYEETPDQDQAIRDVKSDMESPRPMDRLVCGDVGYGKTEVALRAAFKAVMDGRQVAILVPTTVLAQQHYNTFRERMQAFPVRVGVLSRFQSTKEQQRVLDGIRTGTIDIAIGTHRLLQKDVAFDNLGLLVIDEEQRFGVKHKERLKQMRRDIDVLTLTATPIPRSLHMALMHVRDLSVIATPPEGRLPIKTFLEPFDEYHIREAMLREVDRGGQIYFVHNRVQTIEAMAERLRRLVPQARLQIAHGQMPEADLERVMFAFADKQYDLLICSTIIENGLDIPNVNTMIVNDAPQFGLSQLYQLRGRIGRGNRRGYAYLLYNPNVRITRTAERRLKAIFESTELGAGFQIAMKDLEIRGAGNVLGSSQHGHMTAVGFQLYASMLAEAIERQRRGGEAAPAEAPQPVISVHVDAFIPDDYVEDGNQRLRLYQRLASVKSADEVADLEVEFRDRFGPVPDSVAAMLATVRIKVKAARLGIQDIKLDPTSLVVRGTPTTLYDRQDLYARHGMAARIDRGILRLPATRVGDEPLKVIEHILDGALTLRAPLAVTGSS
ncbi:MAG: transcription-repair coupling factor [Chloroflexota bacterium]